MYNRAIAHCTKTKTYSYYAIRAALTNDATVPAHMKCLPVAIRKYAVKDATQAFLTNFAKKKQNTDHRFHVSFKTKKHAPKTLKLESAKMGVKLVDMQPRLFIGDAKERQLSREGIPFDSRGETFLRDTKDPVLQIDSLGRFWLITVCTREPETQGQRKHGVVALDPGVRTFQTTYSPDGTSYKLGDTASNRVYRLLLLRDKFLGLSCRRGPSRYARRGFRQKAAKLMARIEHLVDELHWKTARFLVQGWSEVIIPVFGTAAMSKKYQAARAKRRCIGRKTTRQMLHLRHYTFRQRLHHLAKLTGTKVTEVTEEYTSKTCGNCGVVKSNLGGAKKLRCSSCGVCLDRDGNGARNIFIKSAS